MTPNNWVTKHLMYGCVAQVAETVGDWSNSPGLNTSISITVPSDCTGAHRAVSRGAHAGSKKRENDKESLTDMYNSRPHLTDSESSPGLRR